MARAKQFTVAAIAASLLLTGCAASTRAPTSKPPATAGKLRPVAVSDAEFARETVRVLRANPKAAGTLNLLTGVVRAQLRRAARRFRAGHPDAGFAALKGAFYLVQLGQFRKAMLDASTPALAPAAREAARRGDEGKALALYEYLKQRLPEGPEWRDVKGHLKALHRWLAASKHQPAMVRLGERQRVAMSRAVLEPTRPAVEAAEKRTLEWLNRALALQSSETSPQELERAEAMEAYRALRAGAASIIALRLRHGDAQGGLNMLREKQLEQIVPPSLRNRLERAAERDEPQAWADLHRLFASAASNTRPEVSIDRQLARAAAWGAAWRLYRRAPKQPSGVSPFAELLAEHGMEEVAVRMVAQAFGAAADPGQLSWALALAYNGIVDAMEAEQLAAARAIYREAEPLLKLAEKPAMKNRVRPGASQMHYLVGLFETRSGELASGSQRLKRSISVEPSQAALELLAAIQRQQGQFGEARQALGQAVAEARQQGNLLGEARALTELFELERRAGQAQAASAALERALKRTLDARRTAAAGVERGRVERQLGRILGHYGKRDAAEEAFARSLDAASSSVEQLAATIQEATRAALVAEDVPAARDLVRQALQARLPDEDIAYAALWLKLAEQRAGRAPDGTVSEALAEVETPTGWVRQLRAWARGDLSDQGLEQAAKTPVERTEATFYVSLSKSKAGEIPTALRKVAASKTIHLVEVHIARDMLAHHRGQPPAFPSGVELP